MSQVTLKETGEIFVNEELAGRIEGLRFLAGEQPAQSQNDETISALQQTVTQELATRTSRLEASGHDAFVLASDGTVRWQGEPIAKLTKGATVLAPEVRVLADSQCGEANVSRIEARLRIWLNMLLEANIKPIMEMLGTESLSPQATSITSKLVSNLGVISRDRVAQDVKTLDPTERSKLREKGIRFGAYHIYIPILLKPAPRLLSLQLWAIYNDADLSLWQECAKLASSGRTSFAVEPALPVEGYRLLGYRKCGTRAVRVDILERFADLIRPAVHWKAAMGDENKPEGAEDGDCFSVTPKMTSLLGASAEEMAEILTALHYRCEKVPITEPEAVTTPVASANTAESDQENTPEEASEPTVKNDTEATTDTQPQAEAMASSEADKAPDTDTASSEGEATKQEATAPVTAVATHKEVWSYHRPAPRPQRQPKEGVKHFKSRSTPEGLQLEARPAHSHKSGSKKFNKPRRDEGEQAEKYNQRKNKPAHERKERKADPDSPFAALASLLNKK